MIALRSSLYWLGLVPITIFFCVIAMLILPFPARFRYAVISHWSKWMLGWLALTCGLRYRVEGQENIPKEPCLIFCKHQSAWETLALQQIFPALVFVAKRELLWIPFFGWALATISTIAINRESRSGAAKQLREQGADRVKKGFCIAIFPEGTRMAAGVRGRYQNGAARLAMELAVPIVPVAHNAGSFWPKDSYLKQPGEIVVRIGAPISPDGRTSKALTHQAEEWIEGQMQAIQPVHSIEFKKS